MTPVAMRLRVLCVAGLLAALAGCSSLPSIFGSRADKPKPA